MSSTMQSELLLEWIGDDSEDLLIAYSYSLRNRTIELMAAQNELQGIATMAEMDAINKAAGLMGRLSIDFATIHKQLFPPDYLQQQ